MAGGHISLHSVVWREWVDKEMCIKLPVIGEKRSRIHACVQIVREGRTIYIEVEAFDKRWRYALADACHSVTDWGIGRLRLCVQTVSGGVRIVLQGCIAVDGIKKCWTLIGKDICFLKMSELKEGELMMLGFADSSINGFALDRREELGAVESNLTLSEVGEVIRQDDA